MKGLFSLILALLICYSAHAAEAEIPGILANATFYLFTNPSQCGACQRLEQKLEASHQQEFIMVTFKEKTYQLPVKKIDPWVENSDQYEKFGYLALGIPQFSIVAKGEVRGASLFNVIFNVEFQKIDKNQLLPRKNEGFKKYVERLDATWSESTKGADNSLTNLSADVLRSLGISDEKLKPNPNFKPKTADNNILIVGTSNLPTNNPVFNGITINKVISYLSEVTNINPVVLYGTGTSPVCDTCQVRPGVKVSRNSSASQLPEEDYYNSHEIVKYNLKSDESPTRENIVSFFKSAKESGAKKNLVVLVGHGIQTGFPTWLDPLNEFTPGDLEKLDKYSGSKNVLVSGNCYGGIMANSVSCAFLGAPPDAIASGCWEDAETGNELPDYVSVFFKSLKDPKADYNSDGKVSFSEAHAYATLNGVLEDKPFTSIDALADEYFKKTADTLYQNIQIAYLQRMLAKRYGSPEEVAVVNELTKQYKPTDFIPLKKEIKEVNLGPITATYSFDPNTSEHSFTNVKVTDLALLRTKGLPEGVNTVRVETHTSTDDNGNEANNIGVVYADPDPTWGAYISEIPMVGVFDALKASGMNTDDHTTYYGNIVRIGPFEGKVDSFSDNYVNIRDLKVIDEQGFAKIVANNRLPEDLLLQELTVWKIKPDAYLFYKSESRKENSVLYTDLSLDLQFNFTKTINRSLLTVARRLIFKDQIKNNRAYTQRLESINSCSQQSVSDFLNK